MRKLFITLMTMAALSACSKTAFLSKEAQATFQLNLDTPSTKAFSDGSLATQLQVLVYSASKGFLPDLSYVAGSTVPGHGALPIDGSATVTLKLIKGESYSLVFWAQTADAPYTINPAEGMMTVNPAGSANAPGRDAFYKLFETGTVSAAITESITLKRPLAQINVFTAEADYAAAVASQVNFTGSSMTLTAPSRLNLRTGAVSTPVTYTFSTAAIDVNESTALPGYKYVAMNYVLASTDGTSDISFGVYKDTPSVLLGTLNVANVPFKSNYRTNIKGNVFSVEGQFTVTIDPVYQTPDNEETL